MRARNKALSIYFLISLVNFSGYSQRIISTVSSIESIDVCALTTICSSFGNIFGLAYHPDGNIYGIQRTSKQDSTVIVKCDLKTCTTTFIANTPIRGVSINNLSIDYLGRFYIFVGNFGLPIEFRLIRFSLETLVPEIVLDADVNFQYAKILKIGNEIYAWDYEHQEVIIYNEDFKEKKRFVLKIPIAGLTVGLVNCDSTLVHVFAIKVPIDDFLKNHDTYEFIRGFTHLIYDLKNNEVVETICDILPPSGVLLRKFVSPDEFLASDPNCDLRIDLDADNSSKLYPYDFLSNTQPCTSREGPLSDLDLSINSSAPIDSIIITVHDPAADKKERIVITDALPAGYLLYQLSDSLWVLKKPGGGQADEYTIALKRLKYSALGSSVSGSRSVSLVGYNRLRVSPVATMFITIGVKGSSGADAEIRICDSDRRPINALISLGPEAIPGGRWSQPDKVIHDTIRPPVQSPLTLSYITGDPVCGMDTALLTIYSTAAQVNIDPRVISGKKGYQKAVMANTLGAGPRYAWTPEDIVNCTDCKQIQVTVTRETLLKVTLTDTLGCMAYDSIPIKLLVNNSFFIPNTFSPNGDGFNDELRIYSEQNTQIIIELANVYNRWGDLLSAVRNIPADQPFWDGRFKNVEVPPGVYVYQIRYRLEDGTEGYLKGDVTVLR